MTTNKSILVVSVGAHTGRELKRELTELFGDYARVDQAFCDQLPRKAQGYDIVLLSSESTAELCSDDRDLGRYLLARRVINHGHVGELISLAPGTKVLLVNDCVETALEAIDQLIEIGFDYLDYVPYYPGCTLEYNDAAVAVTPGEAPYTPAHVRRVIDIGVRRLDIQTLYDVMMALGVDKAKSSSLVTSYIREIVSISKKIDMGRIESERTNQLLQAIFDSVDSGIAFVDEHGVVNKANAVFASLLHLPPQSVLSQPFDRIFPDFPYEEEDREGLINVGGDNLLVDRKAVCYGGQKGRLVTLRSADAVVRLDHRIRSQRDKALRQGLHTLEEYRTWDPDTKRTLRLAARFASTDATILIEGESGTGKEIIAQGIHMASRRRNRAFVPVNVNALHPALLESELFGYEEGSFTGAKKGGKAGLFEMAHEGTLFIDEIGDAPMDLQVKLLRALEGRRIRKVGGGEEIPVDVRIVAATNQNLTDLIRQGKFRQDLYFRLNVLPLRTVPLRHRPADVMGLFCHFSNVQFHITDGDKRLDPQAARFLAGHHWPGNVRELMNLVEYVWLTADTDPITVEHLPAYVFDRQTVEDKVRLGEAEWLVLSAVRDSGARRIGRGGLVEALRQGGSGLKEGRIRAILAALEHRGLIETNRTGSIVTSKGIGVLEDGS